MSQVNAFQLLQLLNNFYPSSNVAGFACPLDYVEHLVDIGVLHLPCDISNLFWLRQRMPVLTEIRRSVRTSVLLQQLLDRVDDTVLVVDSMLSGSASLFLVHLHSDIASVQEWISKLNTRTTHLTLLHSDYNMVMAVALSSFVFMENDA